MASVEPSSVKPSLPNLSMPFIKQTKKVRYWLVSSWTTLYAELNEKYYGLSKEDNPEIQYEWARIPHFYYNYYVFQYSTGFAAASALAEKIVHGTQEDRDKYIDYLKAGNSDYPLNVIRKAGVDMEKEDYLDAAFAVFERRLNEFEALVEKLGLA